MSRKTSEIKKSIENMILLQKQLAENSKNQQDEIARKNQALLNELELELKNLNTWFDMIYKYNGKSKSNVKVAASRENGKKGGRPPKVITDLKKQIKELTKDLELVHAQKLATFDSSEEAILSQKEDDIKTEIQDIENNIERLTLLKKQTSLTQNETEI